MEHIEQISLENLHASPTNPRQTFDAAGLKELALSIAERGIIVPLIVRKNAKGYEIVAGERRFRAAKIAKLASAPAIVRTLTDEAVLEAQVIENEQREDVHPLEQATGYERLVKAGLTAQEVAGRIGKTPTHVRQRLQYVNLIKQFREMFFKWQIGVAHADLLARLQPEQQKQAADWFRFQVPSPSHLSDTINRQFFLILKDAAFDTESAELVPKAGSCLECTKRTGNSLLFGDVKDKDTCTDPPCFEEKTKAFIKIQVGTHPDAILLSIGQSRNEKPKGLTEWTKAGNKSCKDTKEGVVVEKVHAYEIEGRENLKLGQVLKVCTNPGCKTHKQAPVRSMSSISDGDRAKAKARKLELHRRGLLFAALSQKSFTVSQDERREVLDHMIDGLNTDNARSICKALDLNLAKGQFGGKDYNASITKYLTDLPAAAVERWIFLLILAEKDLYYGNYLSTTPKAKRLEAKATEAGVSLAEVSKQAKEKPKPAAKAKKEKSKKK